MNRIGIDCRLAGLKHAGIGRYISNLVKRLIKNHPQVTWVLFFSSRIQAQEVLGELFANKNIVTIYTAVAHYSIWEQLTLPVIFKRANLDLLHVPHFNIPLLYSGKFVVTIHDLLWHQKKGLHVTTLPAWKYWVKYWFYRLITRMAVTRAQHIFVPAETVKKTVVSYFPQVKHKISITYEGVDEALKQAGSKISERTAGEKKTLLYVGSLYPHKNLQVVVKALPQLPDYTLRIVSARGVFLNRLLAMVDGLDVADQVKIVGSVSDQELLEEYKNAGALVQPSLSEGFGLTGLEAMAAGTSVIASDIPIFTEIYQDAAILFDPADPDSFAAAVKSLSPEKRVALYQNSRRVLERYSWDTMASQTFELYQKS